MAQQSGFLPDCTELMFYPFRTCDFDWSKTEFQQLSSLTGVERQGEAREASHDAIPGKSLARFLQTKCLSENSRCLTVLQTGCQDRDFHREIYHLQAFYGVSAG